MNPADLQIIRDARFHHSALAMERAFMRNPASIARNRQRCEQLRAIVRQMRQQRKAEG